jgi:hypothetical protein
MPTLGEMRHALANPSGASEPPVTAAIETETPLITLEEMRHYIENPEEYLEHYGVKGMKWGVRRSQQLLDRIRGKNPREAAELTNEYNERVGGINSDRKGAQMLREMKVGSVVVIDTEDGPTVVSKQKDGSFRKVTMSVDAQNALRTTTKDPSEMSTREMNDAVKRAQAIEAYNKIFNPAADPNAELKAKVEAMNLQMQYAQAHAKLNPSRAKKVGTFVSDLKPAFDTFMDVDKKLDGAATKQMKKWMAQMQGNDGKIKVEDVTPKSSGSSSKSKKKRSKSAPETVYNITTMGG